MALTKVIGNGVQGIANASDATFLTATSSEGVTLAGTLAVTGVHTVGNNAIYTTENSGATQNLTQSLVKGWANVDCTGTQTIKDSFNVSSNSDGGTGRSDQNLTNNFNSSNWSSPTQGSYEDGGRTTVTQDLTDGANRNGGTSANKTVMFRPENGSSQDCHNLSAMYAGDLA